MSMEFPELDEQVKAIIERESKDLRTRLREKAQEILKQEENE